MSKKYKFTQQEMEYIKLREAEVASLLSSLDTVRQFNVGDYLVRFYPGDTTPELNSYHVERKFEVVYVDTNGLPYIREVQGAKSGGNLMPIMTRHGSDGYEVDYEYKIDPTYADAIIMAQEEDYDPSSLHKDKAKLFKDITQYNKSIKIKLKENSEAVSFVKTLNAGDTFWFSNVTSMVVQEVKPIVYLGQNKSRVDYHAEIITGLTNKGKTVKFSINSLRFKALYTNCPRSYSELKSK